MVSKLLLSYLTVAENDYPLTAGLTGFCYLYRRVRSSNQLDIIHATDRGYLLNENNILK